MLTAIPIANKSRVDQTYSKKSQISNRNLQKINHNQIKWIQIWKNILKNHIFFS